MLTSNQRCQPTQTWDVPFRPWISILAIWVFLASVAAEQPVDLPVATHGWDAWTGVVANAMSFGGRNKEKQLQALQDFQEITLKSLRSQVTLA